MNRLRASFLNLKERLFGYHLTKPEIFLYITIAAFFFINATYVAYPDEFVNLLGGAAINRGGLPYRDFFDHHMPLAWYLSAVLLKLSLNNFVVFRLLWAAFAFGLLFVLGLWIRKNYRDFHNYYLAFFVVYPLLAVYFWFHLFLADSLAVLFFSIAFWILIVQTLTKRISFKAVVVASFSTFALIFSSLSFLYIGAALYLWQAYLLGFRTKNFFWLTLYATIPYVVYLLFLLLTGTFQDFYFSNVTYNQELYIDIPNYVKGRFFNPIKFGLTLIHNFFDGYLPLLSKIKHLDLYLPIGVLSGVATLVLLLLLTWRNWILGGIFFLILVFSAPRSNIQNYKETDYQTAMFLVLGVISATVALYMLKRLPTKGELLNDFRRVAQFLITLFFVFSLIFLFANTYKKAFLRYTQQLPGIVNYSNSAKFIDDLLDPGEYYWMGPYEPHNEFFVKKGLIPGKYPTLLPQFRENEHMRQTFIEQFDKNPPKIVIYIHWASVFTTPALEFGKFFVDWMEPRYTPIEHIRGVRALRSPTDFHFTTDLYIRNDKVDEVVQRLKNTGYLE